MLHFIVCLIISIWVTSTLFMLTFWAHATITSYQQEGKILVMPLWLFLLVHFCPIVHTVRCFKIMKKVAELQAEKRRV